MARSKKTKKQTPSFHLSNAGLIVFFSLVGFLLLFSLAYDLFYEKSSEQKPQPVPVQKADKRTKPKRTYPPPAKKEEEIQEARYVPPKKRQPVPGPKLTFPELDSPIIEDSIVPRTERPKIAIVIDDMGLSKKYAKELFKIKEDLTFSILPERPYSRWVAQEGHKRGYEIMAHIPMEPLDISNKLGKGGLYTWMSDLEIKETIVHNLKTIPYVVGFNNHMGSAFTQDRRAVSAALSGAKGRKLFFLDSVTTSQTVAASVSRQQGFKTYRRDVFLDAQTDYPSVESQWKRLVKIANKKGEAIAIGHPHKNTIKLLKKVLPSQKISVVHISKITAR